MPSSSSASPWRASRERIVTAADAERRRIERNLHDGAQQRLVTLALQLSLIQRRIRDNPGDAEQLVASASDELRRVLGVLSDPAPDQGELEGEGHQPLLRAVVQVALEPPALLVACGHQALARRAQLLQLRLGLRVQVIVLERDRRGGADRLHQFWVVVER